MVFFTYILQEPAIVHLYQLSSFIYTLDRSQPLCLPLSPSILMLLMLCPINPFAMQFLVHYRIFREKSFQSFARA